MQVKRYPITSEPHQIVKIPSGYTIVGLKNASLICLVHPNNPECEVEIITVKTNEDIEGEVKYIGSYRQPIRTFYHVFEKVSDTDIVKL